MDNINYLELIEYTVVHAWSNENKEKSQKVFNFF